MKVAALDLGSNTFLCLIAEGEGGRLERVIADEVETVRLGQDVSRSGKFHDDALERADSCLGRFRALIDREKVDHIQVCATAAARSVKNAEDLLAIGRKHGFRISVISGEDEARLSYFGAWSTFQDERTRLVIDIGGGSTELVVGRGERLVKGLSLPLGGVRQTEAFVSAQPVPDKEAEAMKDHVDQVLAPSLQEFAAFGIEELVAVAGTPTAIAAVELGGFDAAKVDGFRISRARLQEWIEIFRSTSVEEKKRRFGLGGRADIIFAGVVILERIVSGLGFEELRVSARGLRYGVAMDLLSSSSRVD